MRKLKNPIMKNKTDTRQRHKKLPKQILVHYCYLIFLLYLFDILIPYMVMAGMNPRKTCGDATYYEPYITVYRKIRGRMVVDVPPGGFLDASQLCDKFIYLNGPVMIYEAAVDTSNGVIYDPTGGVGGSVSNIRKREIKCVAGENGMPPGFNCNATGSGSGPSDIDGSTTTVMSIPDPSPEPVTSQTDPVPFMESTTAWDDMDSTTAGDYMDSTTVGDDMDSTTAMETWNHMETTTETVSTTEPDFVIGPVPIPETTTPRDDYESTPDVDLLLPIEPAVPPTVDWKACLFKAAVLEVFDHKCFKLNQLPKKSKIQSRIVTSSGHSTGCNLDDVIGRKVYGIKMLTTEDDYRIPSLTHFEHPDFETRMKSCPPSNNSDIKGHSFAAIGTKDQFDFCHSKKNKTSEEFIRLYMEKVPKSPGICLYEPGMKDHFDEFMHGKPPNYFNWQKCPSKLSGATGTGMNNTIFDFGHFAIIGMGASPVKLDANSRHGHVGSTTTRAPTGKGHGKKGNTKSAKKYQIALDSNCTVLPVLDVLKCGGKEKTKDTCKMLDVGLNTGTDDGDDPQIKMRRDALGLIDGIYEKICVNIPSDFPIVISRILLFYMEQTRLADPAKFPLMKNDTWRFLRNDLQTCLDNAEPMEFLYDEVSDDGDDNGDDDDDSIHGRSLANKTVKQFPDNLDDSETTNRERKKVELSDAPRPEVLKLTSGNKASTKTHNAPDTGDALGHKKRNGHGAPSTGPKAAYKRHDFLDGILDELVLEKRESPYFTSPDLEKIKYLRSTKEKMGSIRDKRSSEFLKELESSFVDEYERRKRNTEPNSHNILPRPIQEFDDEDEYEEDIPMLPTNIQVKHSLSSTAWGRSVSTDTGIKLFYYAEAAELEYDFNVVLDAHWKIFATVLGYCNKFYKSRKAETFPRLYNTYFEDILEPIEDTWISSSDNDALELIVSLVSDPITVEWLNSCLEASYIVSDSITFRPPRPLTITEGSEMVTNYFEEIPKPEYFIPEKMLRAMGRLYEMEISATDAKSKKSAKAKGRSSGLNSSDANCHWSCNSAGECHKDCGPHARSSSKGVNIRHGPDGEETPKEVDISDGLDSSEEYATFPGDKIPPRSDDDTEPRKSRTLQSDENLDKNLHSIKKMDSFETSKQKLLSLKKIARNLKYMKRHKDKGAQKLESNLKKPNSMWHTGTVRKHGANRASEKPIVQQDEINLNEEKKFNTVKKRKKNKALKHLSQKENKLAEDFKKFFKEHDQSAKYFPKVHKSKKLPKFHVMARKLPTFNERDLLPLEVVPSPIDSDEAAAIIDTDTSPTTSSPRLATTTEVTGDKTMNGRRILIRKRKPTNRPLKKARHLGYGKG